MNDKKPWIIGGVAVLVVLAIVLLGRRDGAAPQGPEVKGPESGPPGTESPVASSAPVAGSGQKPTPKPASSVTQTAKGVVITSPVANAQWEIGVNHDVLWSKGFGVTGGAELLDGVTRANVGWVNPSIKEYQQSFTWDGRYVLLGRTNPQQKEVLPGIYIIRVNFDKGYGSAESPSFTLTKRAAGGTLLQTMAIKGGVLSPSKVTAKKGDKVYFVNNDSVSYELRISSFLTQTIPAGGSWTLDTTLLDRTSYPVTATGYLGLRGTVVVE